MSITSGRILTLIPTPFLHRTPSSLRFIRRLNSSPLPPPAPFGPREWSRFVNRIAGPGSEYRNEVRFHEFSSSATLTLAFLNDASAFLDFARQFPTLFWRLPREDIKVVVENVSPSLFEDERDVTSRMRSVVTGGATRTRDPGRPSTVDLMKFLLSYVHMALVSSEEVHRSSEVESSVRTLLTELVKTRGTSPASTTSVNTQLPEGTSAESITSVHTQLPDGNGSETRSPINNMEMKRGDWICTRCSFMNYAKNKICRECEELRPKKVLTGGEWECPQCDFFNFSRNSVCLRCDCKKPEVSPLHSPTAPATVSGLGANSPAFKSNSVKPLAESESKQQPRESRYSTDKNLPEKAEIMPMRTGENRFVVSQKKDRSLSSPIYKRRAAIEQAGSSNHVPFVPFPSNYFAQDKPAFTQASVESKQIGAMGSDPAKTEARNEDKPSNFYKASQNMDQTSQLSNSHDRNSESGNSSTTDMYNASQEIENTSVDNMPWRGRSLEGSAVKEPDPLDMSEEAKAERWFRRVAQIKDISELSQIPDEDFPSIMPLRKGVNRFVVSKRKTPLERRFTSSQYQRNIPVDNSESNPGQKDVQPS